MARLFLFADEAGDFTFNRNPNVSDFYVICTFISDSCAVGEQLLELRRDLAWKNIEMGDFFHASTDRQQVRNHVFNVVSNANIEIQATIMEKCKAQPQVRISQHRFYKYGWHYHFQNSSNLYLNKLTELHLTVASIGTKRKKLEFEDAVKDVISQKITNKPLRVSFWPCQSDPCLWVADYCTWAIQRKYESGGRDVRSYNLIRNKITYEYDLWAHGTIHYY
ncbi:MAG: DUF3800 domain-containing protein [Roseiarcus sp.]